KIIMVLAGGRPHISAGRDVRNAGLAWRNLEQNLTSRAGLPIPPGRPALLRRTMAQAPPAQRPPHFGAGPSTCYLTSRFAGQGASRSARSGCPEPSGSPEPGRVTG